MPEQGKPKQVPPFRWKYLAPALVILAAVTLFLWLALDPLLKWSLRAGGEFIFGAKVDIARVHTRLKPLSLEIQGVQVADKDKPMANLFELEDVNCALEPVPLLSKKVIIDEMRVTGVRWGTARKTSGALPPRKQKKSAGLLDPNGPTGKLMAKVEARAKSQAEDLPAWDSIQKARTAGSDLSVDKLVGLADLKAPQELEALKTEYQQKAASYDGQIKALDATAKVNAVGPSLQALGALKVQTPQDALAAKDTLAQAQQRVQDLQTLLGNVQKLQTQAQADFGQTANLTGRIAEIKDRDLKALSAKFQLPSLSFENVARALVGPLWLGRVNQVLGYVQLARKYLPAGKPKQAAVEAAPSRLRGLDVRFPRANVPPAFWMKTALVSGSTGGPGKQGAAIDFRGLVTDVTSDPAMLGRPTRAKLAGEQGAKAYSLEAELDHTGEVPKDTFTLSARGLEASGLNLPASEYLPGFGRGTVNLAMHFGLIGDRLDTSLEAGLAGLGAPAAQSGSTAQELVRELWTGIDSFQIAARLTGQADDLQMSLTSNLDSLLAARLKSLVGGKLDEYQQKLRQQIDRLTAGKQSELLNQFGSSGQGVLGQLSGAQKTVQDKLNEFQKVIKEKQDAANQVAEKQKQELQQKTNDQLQNLFKR